MANLKRLANVQIALRTTGIREQSFSDMLILGDHALSVNRVITITGADELLDLGLKSTDPLYLAAQAAFSQIPSVPKVYVGRRAAGSVAVAVTGVGGATYKVTVGWRDTEGVAQSATATYSLQAGDTPSMIASGLSTALNGLGATVTATSTDNTVTVVPSPASAPFSVSTAGNLAATVAASTEPVADALAACLAENGEWYGVVITSRTPADVLAAAQWTEANERLFVTASPDRACLDGASTTDVMAKLHEGQFFRTACWYHRDAAKNYLDAAVMGKMFTFTPGSETWANQRLAAITIDPMGEGQYLAAAAKDGNTFEAFRNFAITQCGRVAGGEWIDIIRFRDWVAESMRVNVGFALINANGKIPYTDHGIQIARNAMAKTLELGVVYGGIAPKEANAAGDIIPSYTISVPLASEVPANDKANRILRNLRFTARLAGAIHLVEVTGSMSYEL